MLDFSKLIGRDQSNISIQLAEQAKSEFQSLFRGDPDLERVFKQRPTSKIVEINLRTLVERSLSEGISHLICGVPKLGHLDFHTEFFCHYFTVFWNNATDEFRSGLKGRLFQGGQDRRHLVSLYYEFIVAFAYLSKGAIVRPPSPTEGSYDYEVAGASNSYAVEIKTIEFNSGYPFNTDQMHRQMTRLQLIFMDRPDQWPEYHVQVRYIGPRRPSGHLLEGEINSAIKLFKTGRGAYSGRLVDILVLRKAIFKDVAPEKLSEEAARRGFSMISRSETLNRPGEVVVSTVLPWGISEEVAKLMKDVAGRQLPPGRESAMWIYIIGAQAIKGIEADLQRRLFNPKMPSGKELLKQRKSDVVALHIGGDPWTFVWDDDPNMIGLEFGHFVLSAKPEAFARYRNEVRKNDGLNWAG